MMPSCLSILFRALRIEWRETKRTLFPTTPIETGLFLFFFLLYGCIGYRMVFSTELIRVQVTMYPTGEREVTWAMTIYSISTRAEEHSTSAIPFSASSIC